MLAPVQADEPVLSVDVQSLVGGDDGRHVDLLDFIVASAALHAFAILFLKHLEPGNRIGRQALEVSLRILDALLDLLHRFFSLEAIVSGDSFDADLGKANNVLVRDFATELSNE